VNPVSDGFLFTDAQIAATLLGLLLLGGFFYLESGFRDAGTVKAQGAPFLRATTKFTMLLYALVVSIALGLVVLRPIWVLSIYAVLSLGLIRALLEWTRRYRELGETLPIPRDSPWFAWPTTVFILVLPFVLDGWEPSRQAMTLTLLLAGTLALMSTADLLLTSFDLKDWEEAARKNRPSEDSSDDSSGMHEETDDVEGGER